MGDVLGMVVGMVGSVKSWFMAGGPLWLSVMLLMLLMWISRWSGNAELRWWAVFLNLVGFASCLILVLIGDPANVNAAAQWGMRWLYPLGGMFLFYFVEHGKLVIPGGGGEKK